jgi:hypothetical protein
MDIFIQILLASELVRDESLVLRCIRFTPAEKNLGTYGWIPEPVWTTRKKEKILELTGTRTPTSVFQPIASRYTDCATPVPKPIR